VVQKKMDTGARVSVFDVASEPLRALMVKLGMWRPCTLVCVLSFISLHQVLAIACEIVNSQQTILETKQACTSRYPSQSADSDVDSITTTPTIVSIGVIAQRAAVPDIFVHSVALVQVNCVVSIEMLLSK
jgi:hypothetical protein